MIPIGTDFDIAEALRRAQLARQLVSTGGGTSGDIGVVRGDPGMGGATSINTAGAAPVASSISVPPNSGIIVDRYGGGSPRSIAPSPNLSPAAPAIQPSQTTPPSQVPLSYFGQNSPRDQALAEYRDVLNQPPPNINDPQYKPSIGRRIAAALLGGIAGLHDPKTGYTVGHGTAYGKFDQAMSDYQRRLAQKKEAFETEQGVAKESATEEELKARRGAEEERAAAEHARRLYEEYRTSDLAHQREMEKIWGRGFFKEGANNLYEIPLKNGKTVVASKKGDEFVEIGTGTPLGPDTYDASKIHKVGTTVASEKEPNQYRDFREGYIDKYKKTHGGKDPSTDEIADAWEKEKSKYAKPGAIPIVIGPGNIPQRAVPGVPLPEGSRTVQQFGSEAEETSATKTMIEAAPTVVKQADRVLALVDQMDKSLGPWQSRYREFLAGKAGVKDPQFTKLRSAAFLLRGILNRMHMGARGGQRMIMEHYRDLLDTAIQDPENLRAAIEEIKAYASLVLEEKKGQGAQTPTEGTEAPKPETKKLTPEELRKKYNY